MLPKARMHAALQRRPVDRVPVWLWYHPEIYARLHTQHGWDSDTADTRLGNDVRQVHLGINREMFRPLAEGERFIDEWGVTWIREGWYNQVCASPLAGMPAEALPAYRFPDSDAASRFAPLASICDRFSEEYFIGADVSGSIFEPCCHLRGMDQLLIDMLESPEQVAVLFDAAAEFTIRVCARALDFPIDWIWLGDDLGGQGAMLISPALWRELLKPRLAAIISAVKRLRPGIPVAYHSCGAIRPVIPDLLDIGVDVLNPLQPLCPGMDPLELKREFGDRVVLMGGLDTQDFLPHADPGDITAFVQAFLADMDRGGGYILAASHTIQPDTPLENIAALVDGVGQFRHSRQCAPASL